MNSIGEIKIQTIKKTSGCFQYEFDRYVYSLAYILSLWSTFFVLKFQINYYYYSRWIDWNTSNLVIRSS